MEKIEIRRGEAEPNFKFFHNPYSPSAEYEAIFSITRHQPGGICTKITYSQVLWESTSSKDDASLLLHGTQTPWSAEHYGSYTTFFP